MSEKRMFVLRDMQVRQRAAQAVYDAPVDFEVRISPPSKSRDQEKRYHAMIGDIAKQWKFMGRRWDSDDVKRILVEAFAQAMREAGTPIHHDGRVVPSLDGKRVVQLGIQTRRLWRAEASQFIEFLSAWGAENGIEWSNEGVMA